MLEHRSKKNQDEIVEFKSKTNQDEISKFKSEFFFRMEHLLENLGRVHFLLDTLNNTHIWEPAYK